MSAALPVRKYDAIVDFSGVEKFIDTPVKRYSSGMYVRLAFSVAAHLEPEILLVDEVLSVGDAESQRRCLGRIERDVDEPNDRHWMFSRTVYNNASRASLVAAAARHPDLLSRIPKAMTGRIAEKEP